MSTIVRSSNDVVDMPGSGIADSLPDVLPRSEGSDRFFAFDVRSSFFSNHRGGLKELSNLYLEVFNEVEAVKDKWTTRSASNAVEARLRKPGCNIVLIDVAANEKVIGAFLANIFPGRNGWTLSEPDVLVHADYRKLGLGRELGWVGRKYADDLNQRSNGEGIVENSSKTYSQPEFPKSAWKRYGYDFHPLFNQSARELISRPLKGITANAALEEELPAIANFISDRERTVSSDGEVWSLNRAQQFVFFMHSHNYSTFSVAKRGDTIVAVSAGDIIPGRTGPSLVEARCFVKSSEALAEIGAKGLTQDNVAASAFYELFASANGAARQLWHQALTGIEVPKPSCNFFRKILPGLKEDGVFIAMSGDHHILMRNMEPVRSRQKITLIPFYEKSTLQLA